MWWNRIVGDLSARIVNSTNNTFRSLEQNINAMAERVTLAQEELQQKIDAATDELRLRKEEAELLARIDVLTGIPNRRAFMVAAEQEILRAQRYGTPLSVALLDLDLFKAINDGYGHGTGDHVRNDVAMLANSIREVDIVGRLGGEEFAILMPGTPLHEAVQAIDRIRESGVESCQPCCRHYRLYRQFWRCRISGDGAYIERPIGKG